MAGIFFLSMEAWHRMGGRNTLHPILLDKKNQAKLSACRAAVAYAARSQKFSLIYPLPLLQSFTQTFYPKIAKG